MASVGVRKPRFLCLHGFRSSGEILKKQVHKWPESVLEKLDLVYLDGPSLAQGKFNVEAIFDYPCYEWFQTNQDMTVYYNFEKCLDYIEDFMIKDGPFDGLLGFSQGAFLSAALPGLQAKGVALTKVPKLKFVIVISGAKMKDPTWAANAYADPIQCPSLHFLGKEDIHMPDGKELLQCFVDPIVIEHPEGHTIPRLDDQSLPIMLSYVDKIQKLISKEKEPISEEQTDLPLENRSHMIKTVA